MHHQANELKLNRVRKLRENENRKERTDLLAVGASEGGTLYEFPDGLPMVAPLSSLVADVFMDHFETDLLYNSLAPKLTFSLGTGRFVDDVFCAWTGSSGDLTSFLTYLNSIHPSMQFTLEIGGLSHNYLDLSISFHPSSSHQLSPQFPIFRKS